MGLFGVLGIALSMAGGQAGPAVQPVTFHSGIVDVYESDKDIRLAVADLFAAKFPHMAADYYLDPAVHGSVFVDLHGVTFYDALKIMLAQVGAGYNEVMGPPAFAPPNGRRDTVGKDRIEIVPAWQATSTTVVGSMGGPTKIVFGKVINFAFSSIVPGELFEAQTMRAWNADGRDLLSQLLHKVDADKIRIDPAVQGKVTVDVRNSDSSTCVRLVLDALHAGVSEGTIEPSGPDGITPPDTWTLDEDSRDIRLVLAQILESDRNDPIRPFAYEIAPDIRRVVSIKITTESLDDLMIKLAAAAHLELRMKDTTYVFCHPTASFMNAKNADSKGAKNSFPWQFIGAAYRVDTNLDLRKLLRDYDGWLIMVGSSDRGAWEIYGRKGRLAKAFRVMKLSSKANGFEFN